MAGWTRASGFRRAQWRASAAVAAASRRDRRERAEVDRRGHDGLRCRIDPADRLAAGLRRASCTNRSPRARISTQPPDTVSAGLSGVLAANGRAALEHAMASIFSLAERGVLAIEEEPRRMLGTRHFEITRRAGRRSSAAARGAHSGGDVPGSVRREPEGVADESAQPPDHAVEADREGVPKRAQRPQDSSTRFAGTCAAAIGLPRSCSSSPLLSRSFLSSRSSGGSDRGPCSFRRHSWRWA